MSVSSRQADSVAIGEPPGNRGPPARSVTGSGTHPFSSTRVKKRQKEVVGFNSDPGARLSEGPPSRAQSTAPGARSHRPLEPPAQPNLRCCERGVAEIHWVSSAEMRELLAGEEWLHLHKRAHAPAGKQRHQKVPVPGLARGGPGSPSLEQSVEAPVIGVYRENFHLAEPRLEGVLTKRRGTHNGSGGCRLRVSHGARQAGDHAPAVLSSVSR